MIQAAIDLLVHVPRCIHDARLAAAHNRQQLLPSCQPVPCPVSSRGLCCMAAGNGNGLHPLQVRIALHACQMVKVGGRVVYSTCTFNPVEDEAVVAEVGLSLLC